MRHLILETRMGVNMTMVAQTQSWIICTHAGKSTRSVFVFVLDSVLNVQPCGSDKQEGSSDTLLNAEGPLGKIEHALIAVSAQVGCLACRCLSSRFYCFCTRRASPTCNLFDNATEGH